MHDAVELGEPMERLVALEPRSEGFALSWNNAVLGRQIAVEFFAQGVQTPSQFAFGFRKLTGIHALFGLHFSEALIGAVGDQRFLLDGCDFFLAVGKRQLLLPAPFSFDGFTDFVERDVAHQRVAGPDVEIDVRQRFDLFQAIDLCHQLQKQPQLADLDGLFHDVHAEQIADDDRLEDEVA